MRDTIFTFDITPMGKPRMTQRDKWKNTRTQRADRYLVYKRDLQMLQLQNKFKFSYNMRITFYLPAPGLGKEGEIHQAKPDIDNMVKGFLDSILLNDQLVWHIDAYKYWTDNKQGRIEVEHL